MTESLILHQKINLPYRYTAGPWHRTFLEGLAERRLVAGRCEDCGLVVVPARPFCPHCSQPPAEAVEVGPAGTLVAHTSSPEWGSFGLVQLDGADTWLFHRLDVAAPQIGMRVRPRWAEEPIADIRAIEAFVTE